MRDGFVCPSGSNFLCAHLVPPDPLQCCKSACQPNPALAQLGQEKVCRLFHELLGKERDHLVNTHTMHADTQQMGGIFSMGREPLWSGQLPLLPHLFESLLALIGSSCKHTLTLHKLVHTGFFRFSYQLLLWAPFMAQRRAISGGSTSGALSVVDTSCVSNDHNLASDWPVWREGGGEKSHLLDSFLIYFWIIL